MIKVTLIIILNLITIQISSQSWIGFGKGVEFLEIKNGEAVAKTCDSDFKFRVLNLETGEIKVRLYDSETGKLRNNLLIEIMDQFRDFYNFERIHSGIEFTNPYNYLLQNEDRFNKSSTFRKSFLTIKDLYKSFINSPVFSG